MEDRLADLVVLGIDAMREAGRLLESLPVLWTKTDLGERRETLMTMLDAVYVDSKEEKRIVAVKPKPAFKAKFQIADTLEDSGIILLKNENNAEASEATSDATETDSCSWWRRGMVDLLLNHGIDIAPAA